MRLRFDGVIRCLELADAFTYLLLLADERGIDLVGALRVKRAVLKARHGDGVAEP